MKAVLYLLRKIRRYDPVMLPIMALFTLLWAVYPFIWVVVPSRILALYAQGAQEKLLPLMLWSGALAVGSVFVTTFLRGNYRMRMNKVRYQLIQDLMDYSLSMPYENTLHESALNDIRLARDAVGNPTQGAGGVILTMLELAGGLLSAVGFLGLLRSLPWWMLGAIVVLMGLGFVLSQRRSTLLMQSWEQNNPTYRKKDAIVAYVTDPAARKDNILYHLSGLIRAYFLRLSRDALALYQAVLRRLFGLDAVVALLNLVRDGLLYGYLVAQFLKGRLALSDFYLYMTGVLSFVMIAQQAMTNIATIHRESKRFACFMRLDIKGAERPLNAGRTPDSVPQLLEVQDLRFRYPGTDRDVIDRLNLTIRPGEKVALVGENGSGKSTLIHLLCRLYRPTAGHILWQGRDIWDMPEEDWRQMLSVVFQDAMLLPFSLEENVAMEAQPQQSAVDWAVEQSGLKQVADSLPRGLHTSLLRTLDDDGVDLSGGQRQQLFLARALYKQSARLLILDEPTAALDALAERALYESYAGLCQGRSSLFVSHRLASTAFCDRVLLMENGRIVEEGSHDALLLLGGRYAQLYNIQAKNYRAGPMGEVRG
ncbi:MAG: ABC transporter ATP-binding protein [Clostridiales bacterium]|nr:ABC transporter ATP-binding protein [Clostridiales bacterium]